MKVLVKTLKGTQFEIEVKPEDTVADVKKKIETDQGGGVYLAADHMLIYEGAVLKDSTTLEANKVAESSFVVIMLSKALQTAIPPAPAVTKAPPPAATQPENVYDQAASNLVASSNLEDTIQRLADLVRGTWDRDAVIRALNAADNDPEGALDYLYLHEY